MRRGESDTVRSALNINRIVNDRKLRKTCVGVVEEDIRNMGIDT